MISGLIVKLVFVFGPGPKNYMCFVLLHGIGLRLEYQFADARDKKKKNVCVCGLKLKCPIAECFVARTALWQLFHLTPWLGVAIVEGHGGVAWRLILEG